MPVIVGRGHVFDWGWRRKLWRRDNGEEVICGVVGWLVFGWVARTEEEVVWRTLMFQNDFRFRMQMEILVTFRYCSL